MDASRTKAFVDAMWDEQIVPQLVESGQPDVYWKLCPGERRGCSPTTPSPRTSSTLPRPSVMTQCRVRSWQVAGLSFEIVIV